MLQKIAYAPYGDMIVDCLMKEIANGEISEEEDLKKMCIDSTFSMRNPRWFIAYNYYSDAIETSENTNTLTKLLD